MSFERAVAAKAAAANPRALLALLEGRKSEARSLLSNAAEMLVRRLERRGALCDKTRLCDARVLPSCPPGVKLVARTRAVVAHLVVDDWKEYKHVPKTCVEVCFSKLAIKYVWRADVSRGGDARDKLALERCRILHIHKLAAWWSRHREAAPFSAAAEGARVSPGSWRAIARPLRRRWIWSLAPCGRGGQSQTQLRKIIASMAWGAHDRLDVTTQCSA